MHELALARVLMAKAKQLDKTRQSAETTKVELLDEAWRTGLEAARKLDMSWQFPHTSLALQTLVEVLLMSAAPRKTWSSPNKS